MFKEKTNLVCDVVRKSYFAKVSTVQKTINKVASPKF